MQPRTVLAGTIVLTAFIAFGVTLATSSPTGSQSAGTATVDPSVAEKQNHFRTVVRELSSRDVTHLSDEQRGARKQALEWLAEYSDRGEFTHNARYPNRDMPYFIDDEGKRCALAHLIEQSGDTPLLQDLAATNNNAYISQITAHDALGSWLGRHGMTPEEIAFIQAPGIILPPPPPPHQPDGIIERGDPTPVVQRPPDVTPPTANPGDVTAGATTRGATTRRGKKQQVVGLDWETWWSLNRDTYTNLRTAYHQQKTRTTPGPAATGTRSSDSTRPTADALARDLMPMFEAVASGDPAFASTGLMAIARAGDPSMAADLVDRVLAYVGRPDARYREFAVLTLGVLPHANAVAPLREILQDTVKGRRLLHQASSIPETTRSFAAIALGRIGGTGARDAVLHTLEREAKASIDLASACITALGLIGRDESMQDRIASYLIQALERGEWNATVLAHVPLALARFDSAGARARMMTIVKKFRGPRELRQSSAIALGLIGDGLEPALIDPLMVAAHRDPDPAARQYSIMAIAEIAYREGMPTYERFRATSDLLERLATFYEDGISGFFKQPVDRPWYALSGAIFAQRHARFADRIVARLIAAAAEGNSESERAAAALGLGLTNHPEAIEALRKIYSGTRSIKVRGYSAVALGMLRDPAFKPTLLAIGQAEDESARLRGRAVEGLAYHADPTIVPPLVKSLEATRSDWVRAEMTRVIGELGDRRVVPSLKKIAGDEHEDDAMRQYALGALALLAQKGDVAWMSELKRGYNSAAATSSMQIIMRMF